MIVNMSHTPLHTPIAKPSKKLPMIVDIALDDNGKQMYQVHESSKFIRKEMPKSTKFYNEVVDSDYEEKTPIRKVLGTISPSTLNKKLSDEELDNDNEDNDTDHVPIKHELDEFPPGFNYQYGQVPPHHPSFSHHDGTGLHHDGSGLHLENLTQTSTSNSAYNSAPTSAPASASYQNSQESLDAGAKSNDIWSEDVEKAFEDVLSIIPKNGLNKIKISGRSCGRNELISDYILTKTGKFRTRKQVSSHIQVIKNLGQKLNIIKLINEGPTFETDAQQAENMKKFEEIFSKINLDKSLGLNKKRQFAEFQPPRKKRMNSYTAGAFNPANIPSSGFNPGFNSNMSSYYVNNLMAPISVSLENFYISIYDNLLTNPVILTLQNNQEIQNLKLKPDANISNRFPDLNELKKFPMIHNLVKIYLPSLPMNYSLETGLKTNIVIKDMTPDKSLQSLSIFTVIYSYGKEILKVNEDNIKVNDNESFLLKFWKYFLRNEFESDTDNLNHLTIKQIVHETTAEPNGGNIKLPKSKIKSVFLWEFLKVEDLKEAITTTSKLTLPAEIVPQVVNYNVNYDMNYPTDSVTMHSGQFPPNFTGSTMGTSAMLTSMPVNVGNLGPNMGHHMVPNMPLPTEDSEDKDKLSKPQIAQKKFQALQTEYDYYSQPYYQNYGGQMVQPQPQPQLIQQPLGQQPVPLAGLPGQGSQHMGMPNEYDYQFFYDPNYAEY